MGVFSRNVGLVDAYRALHAEPNRYTFWVYQWGRWQKDEGLRIDHLLLSPDLAEHLVDANVDREQRGKEKASDHAPTWVVLG